MYVLTPIQHYNLLIIYCTMNSSILTNINISAYSVVFNNFCQGIWYGNFIFCTDTEVTIYFIYTDINTSKMNQYLQIAY